MRKSGKRIAILGFSLVVLLGLPVAAWLSLTFQPHFYRTRTELPPQRRREEAKRFVAQGTQFFNDIRNEPRWRAVFTDQEVNAWLAEDLVIHFADQIPPEVHEPRVLFNLDRATLAFQLDQGPIRSIVWVVVRPRVREDNLLAITLEKVRAGVVPIPADSFIDNITAHARHQGLEIHWEREGDLPVAVIRFTPDPRNSKDVVLEQVQVLNGRILLEGRSSRSRGMMACPVLPTRKLLQSAFPKRRVQAKGVSASPRHSIRRKSTTPMS